MLNSTLSNKKGRSLPNFFSKSKSSSVQNTTNSNFIFFGCWNNINCSRNEDTLNRNVVLELLKKLYSTYPIVLAGDNWYSHKIKVPKADRNSLTSTSEDKTISKLKFYPLYVLQTGYKKLFEISKQIDIVLGNHDINAEKLNDFYALNKCDQLGCMIKVQHNVINQMLLGNRSDTLKNIKDVYYYNNVKLYVCKPHIEEKSKGIFFLYLNTNIFEAKDIASIDKYRELVIRELFGKKIKLLFIVGHHPFFGLKKKKTNTSNDNESIPKKTLIINTVADLYFKNEVDKDKVKAINIFLTIFTKYKSIYLCADIHNFQICKLSNNLCMVICGSGGASRDLLDNYADNTKPIPLKCKLNDNIEVTDMYVHDSYGFSKINYSNSGNKVVITYYKIINSDIEYTIFTYTLEYSNKHWNISREKPMNSTFLVTKGDFNTIDHCPKIRAENRKQVDPLLAIINDEKCGTKKK